MNSRSRDEKQSLYLTHIRKINEVIQLMEAIAKDIKEGQPRGKLNFGAYTSPIQAFNGSIAYDWIEMRMKPQYFKSIPQILKEGIAAHQKRIEILEKMHDDIRLISDSEHTLLMQVEALRQDKHIASYLDFLKPYAKYLQS